MQTTTNSHAETKIAEYFAAVREIIPDIKGTLVEHADKLRKELPLGGVYGKGLKCRPILTKPGANAKLSKNTALGFWSAGISLAPGCMSGHEVCNWRTAQCFATCVARNGGAQRYPKIWQSRIAKTKLLFNDPEPNGRDVFLRSAAREIISHYRKAWMMGLVPTFRLNTFSDLDWREFRHSAGWNLFDLFGLFPKRSFVVADYTKSVDRAMRELHAPWEGGQVYWFNVFSLSEAPDSVANAARVLSAGGTCTAVYPHKATIGDRHRLQLPDGSTLTSPLHDGDEHDCIFLRRGMIGLRAKGKAKKLPCGGFVRHASEMVYTL